MSWKLQMAMEKVVEEDSLDEERSRWKDKVGGGGEGIES